MKIAVIVLAIVAVVAIAVAGYVVWKGDSGSGKVPDVVGMAVADAKAKLSGDGFTYTVEKTYSETAAEGSVAKQEPAAGSTGAQGADVTIWVSKGESSVAVPDLAGTSLSDAEIALKQAGLNAKTVAGWSSGQGLNRVYRQAPTAGTVVARGTLIIVYYNAKGPNVVMPALIGLSEAQAAQELKGAGLALGAVGTQPSTKYPMGKVISQSVPATQHVARGSKIDLVLSGGAAMVVVPNVLNVPYKQAQKKLENVGFQVHLVWVKGGGMEPDAVVKVNPKVGSSAPEGSLVVITVEEAPQ